MKVMRLFSLYTTKDNVLSQFLAFHWPSFVTDYVFNSLISDYKLYSVTVSLLKL